MVLFNPCVGPLARIKISLFSLSIFTDELISTPKIMVFLLQLKFEIEKSERESNPTAYFEKEHLSGSAFLVTLTAPNKESFRVKSALKSFDHLSNS